MFAAVAIGALVAQAPLPEGNTYVKALVTRQRSREDAINRYTYDVVETRDELDKRGRTKKRRVRTWYVFHVNGRPVRKLVAEDGRSLGARDQAREDERVREKVEAIRDGRVTAERPGVRISALLERHRFRTVAREERDGRQTLRLEFEPRPDARRRGDDSRRALAGRIWVDEDEGEIVRAEVRNAAGIAVGLASSVSSLDLVVEFTKVDGVVWLPRRVEAQAEGRVLLFKRFRTRTTAEYGSYRRFDVDTQTEVRPPPVN
jgi:hypothetical protein